MGDEVQAIKAGLLEVADLVVVNKGDKPGRAADRGPAPGDAGADGRRADRDPTRPAPKRPEVLVTTAVDRRGRAGAARRARPAPGALGARADRRRRDGRGRRPRSAAILADRLGGPARGTGDRRRWRESLVDEVADAPARSVRRRRPAARAPHRPG